MAQPGSEGRRFYSPDEVADLQAEISRFKAENAHLKAKVRDMEARLEESEHDVSRWKRKARQAT